MKKSTIFLAVALLATIGFYSCENKNSLAGTTWLSEIISTEWSEYQYKIEFYNKNEYKWTDIMGHYFIGKYTYKSSTVSIISFNGSILTGTVNGNKMTLLISGEDVIFTKQ